MQLSDIKYLLVTTLAFTTLSAEANKPFAHVPTTVSPMAQQLLKTVTPSSEKIESIAQWKKVRETFNNNKIKMNTLMQKKYIQNSEHIHIGGVPVLLSIPKSYTKSKNILIYIHGGAYTLGGIDSNYVGFAPLAYATGLKTYLIHYRLAPEHPFPAGLEDTFKVYKKLEKQYGAKHIVMLGDSAGGALCLATLLKARQAGIDLPAALVLYSPWSDIDKIGDSYYTLENIAPLLHYEKNLRDSAKVYAQNHDMKNPLISPVYADYNASFSPTLIQIGTRDLFLSNSARLYRKMKEGGSDVELSLWEGMWHVFQSIPNLPEAEEAVKEASNFIKSKLKETH